MRLDSLQVQNYRNIENASFTPDPQLTVIAGQNGQGKTNLLESIWLLTGSKSFRGSKDLEMVKRDALFGKIEGAGVSQNKTNNIEILVAGAENPKKGRFAKINGVDYGRATSIAGTFTAVVFDPGHLSLTKGGPEGRRKFLDAALCQLYPGYIGILRRFTRAISQKNALLKKYYQTADADSILDVFDAEIAASGEEISRRREDYLLSAGPAAEQFYKEISDGAELLQIQYERSCEAGGLEELLKRKRSTDVRAGFSTTGPQREDFETLLDSQSARAFGSQGQQRSIVLSLKLAEAAMALEVSGEHPVLLLDDVLSELDETRQAYLLSRMSGKQSFVTTCDPAAFNRTAGKIVTVQAGKVNE